MSGMLRVLTPRGGCFPVSAKLDSEINNMLIINIYKIASLAIFISSAMAAPVQESNRNEIAKQLFERRCASAGERIIEQVQDVDGFLLMKLRPRAVNYGTQYRLDDPYGDDLGGEGYIKSFLSAHFDLDGAYRHLAIGRAKLAKRRQAGYEFVEAIDPKDGRRYRYTGFVEQPSLKNSNYSPNYYRVILISALAPVERPRYGVTFDDISTRQDRDYWIAGSSLKVIDLKKNRVIAERVGYMYDPGQGDTSRGRSPWLLAAAHACPAFPGTQPHVHRLGQTAKFVEKVLVPRRKIDSQ